MRNIIVATAVILGLLPAASGRAATSNHTIHVQGVLREITGNLQSMPTGMLVTIYRTKDAALTDFVYQQNNQSVDVENGFFSIELEVPPMSFDGLDDAWVGVWVSGDGGELPRQHLGAVPYAFSAENVSGVVAVAHGGTGSATQNFVDLSSNQPAIAGNKTFTGLVSSARGVDGTPMRVCSGSTPIGSTAWTVYNSSTTAITLKVDTSGCGFESTPHYVTSLGCNNTCWLATGGNSAYNANASGFQIYISYPTALSPDDANKYEWHIEWIAVGN